MATPAINPQAILAALAARNAGAAGGGGAPGGGLPPIMSLLGGGGGPPGGAPSPNGGGGGMPGTSASLPGGDSTAQQYASEYSSLKGADPGLLLRELTQMKQRLAVLMVQNLERLPNVAGQIAKLIPIFARVSKDLQEATNVQGAVRPPIGMGAAMPAAESPGGGGGTSGWVM